MLNKKWISILQLVPGLYRIPRSPGVLAIIATRSMSNNDIYIQYFGSETISTMINISVVKPCSSNTMQQGNKHK